MPVMRSQSNNMDVQMQQLMQMMQDMKEYGPRRNLPQVFRRIGITF